MHWNRRWPINIAAATIAAILLIGACGGDDTNTSDSKTSDTGASDLATWCSAMRQVDLEIAALSSGAGDPAATAAAIDEAEQTAPAEIEESVQALASYHRQIVADAEAGAGEAPTAPTIPPDTYFTASAKAGEFMAEHCDFETIEVTATDYSFAGLDGDMLAGTTLLQFTNDGDEYHEIDVEKLADGEERSADELLELMQSAPDDAAALVTPVALTFAPPHAATFAIFDLEPGRYLAMCHVPVGATPDALQSGVPLDENDPHLLHGMITEFAVT